MDTIFALASARGKSGVAVIRVSGPEAYNAGLALAGTLPEPRKSALRYLRDATGAILDEALVLVFSSGHSFTGEDVVEFHVHGSMATVAAVLKSLSVLTGLRAAEAGEFTRQALENERLDLARVEGLADLIEAETEAQRIQALRVFSGRLGDRAEGWRAQLVRAAALLEATIDFVDEDVPVDVQPEVISILNAVRRDLHGEVAGVSTAERVRDGFEVAIVGAPNVGKSTLLNFLAGRDAAITSEIAGTTRDVIEVRMDLHGLPVTFLDTAGLREGRDVVESLGIERSQKRAEQADLRLFLLESPDERLNVDVRPEDIVVLSKADLRESGDGSISGLTGAGVDVIVERIADILEQRCAGVGVAVRERHRVAMVGASNAIEAALKLVEQGEGYVDIAAEELRSAIRSLDALVGRVDVEHILDEIFSRFCIGK